MAIKPSTKIDWTNGNASPSTVRVEPTAPKKQAGWDIDERPAREWMNWLFYNLWQWQNYFETVTDQLAGLGIVYQAYVGVGALATHADLNAVMADSAIGPGARILVISPLTISTVQQITKNNVSIEFVPTAILTANIAGAGTAIQATATGVQIIRGTFINFLNAILIDVAADNTFVQFCKFKNNTNDVVDNSTTSQEIGSMTLV